MQPVLDGLTVSGFSGAAHLPQWVRSHRGRRDMRFEDVCLGCHRLHDEHTSSR